MDDPDISINESFCPKTKALRKLFESLGLGQVIHLIIRLHQVHDRADKG